MKKELKKGFCKCLFHAITKAFLSKKDLREPHVMRVSTIGSRFLVATQHVHGLRAMAESGPAFYAGT